MSQHDADLTPDLTPTPGQTVGPFFGFALPFRDSQHLVPPGSLGSVRLYGTVYDGTGQPIPDAMLELWQADGVGSVPTTQGSLIRDGHTFTGWGRAGTDNVGGYTFTTLEPGHVQEGSARFFSVLVFARGLLDKLHTRVYLPEDATAHANDPLLSSLSEEERATLIATREPGGALRWDLRLQGDGETVFLDYWADDAAGEGATGNGAQGSDQR
ncbi:protocatechuate 3,4-dioxygenase alpha subunit [Kineosphaera limosa]|uniref:Protocatechuate 3,4-dioxygenase alpha subunit n=1 Tax=Kineosphaera limosa NBRC 100340 TaxID=1184609 RepID=K6X8W0_9MICO|nr:protocatechuate 3,4-dioxygenase subunit alpha [Kineosphaera limosa]NYE02140.1 protocatechuate 3,4-dioxygenase alpha subunit [Kineosphaera limosa]GAB95259.1 protocatechuate 3,4-dioxygenase alpha subunit [Kineosphaera limosa NBRC 100340]